jgi:dolichyl-diphosphooligosaccharide--protein glycosyltransferase
MSWWDYGNWIVYLAHRPVVANNFQAGVDDAARFFVTLDESEANAILDRRNVRYVITDMKMVKTKFSYLAQLAGEDADNFYTVQTIKTRTLQVVNDRFMNTTLTKLHVSDGATLGKLRLVYESHSTVAQNPEVKYVKIFEYVKGAKITGFAAPHENVSAAANVISNRRRTFEYYNTAVANETGWYELTVSYSTEGGPYDTRAVTPYTVRGEKSIIMKEITITEDDVANGGEIRLDLV